MSPPAPTARPREPSPLPEGWVRFESATHNRPFYYHQSSKTTVWQRPVELVEQSRPESPAAPPEPKPAQSFKVEEQVKEPTVTEKRVPTGPAESDLVATAYASRRSKAPDLPRGPAKWSDGADAYRPRRERSPSPRDDPIKRFKGDDGRYPPPLSARHAAMDRSTFLSAFFDFSKRFGYRQCPAWPLCITMIGTR